MVSSVSIVSTHCPLSQAGVRHELFLPQWNIPVLQVWTGLLFLKNTLLFSNVDHCVRPDQRSSFQHVTVFSRLSSLTSLLDNFSLTWPRFEGSFPRTMSLDDFHRNTMRRQQSCCLKSLSRITPPPPHPDWPVNYSKTPERVKDL